MAVVTNDGRFVILAGAWDNAVKVASVRTRRVVHSALGPNDVVTCLALDETNTTLMTGCRDGTCMVWGLQRDGRGERLGLVGPLRVLYGHKGPINAIALNTELDITASASRDGTCNIHTLQGVYVRTLRPPPPSSLVSDTRTRARGDSLSRCVRVLCLC